MRDYAEWHYDGPNYAAHTDKETHRLIQYSIRGGEDGGQHGDAFDVSGGISRANARLMASAPGLLWALQNLLSRVDSHFGGHGDSHDWEEQQAARTQITKATGEAGK